MHDSWSALVLLALMRRFAQLAFVIAFGLALLTERTPHAAQHWCSGVTYEAWMSTAHDPVVAAPDALAAP